MGAAHRFFVDDPVEDTVALAGPVARQIATVLRLATGDTVTLVHGGDDIEVRLDRVAPGDVRGTVLSRGANAAEPSFHLTLALPVLKGDRSEEVVEAVTQLGVARIVPFVSSRSVVRTLSPAKRRRWQQIARESAETARRGLIPAIDEVRDWARLFDADRPKPTGWSPYPTLPPPVVVAWEGELRVHLLHTPAPHSLVIGPEGGLSEEEIALARAHAATIVSLGRRNLRSETAAIAATAMLLARA